MNNKKLITETMLIKQAKDLDKFLHNELSFLHELSFYNLKDPEIQNTYLSILKNISHSKHLAKKLNYKYNKVYPIWNEAVCII